MSSCNKGSVEGRCTAAVSCRVLFVYGALRGVTLAEDTCLPQTDSRLRSQHTREVGRGGGGRVLTETAAQVLCRDSRLSVLARAVLCGERLTNARICQFHAADHGVNACVVCARGFGVAAGFCVFQLWVQEGTATLLLASHPDSVAKSFANVGNVIMRCQRVSRWKSQLWET